MKHIVAVPATISLNKLIIVFGRRAIISYAFIRRAEHVSMVPADAQSVREQSVF